MWFSDGEDFNQGWAAPVISFLPPQRCLQRKTLVLDLDHTLIDCIREAETSKAPHEFIYTDSSGVRGKVFCRPFLVDFLKAVVPHFEIVLFTAAGARHADAVLAHLDPNGTIFEHRLYAEHTSRSAEWSHIKDLTRLGRNLAHTLLVDDCPVPAANTPSANLLNVTPFHNGDTEDTTLRELANFLLNEVLPAEDVRNVLADLKAAASAMVQPPRRLRHGLSAPAGIMNYPSNPAMSRKESHKTLYHGQSVPLPQPLMMDSPAFAFVRRSEPHIKPDMAMYSLATRSTSRRSSINDDPRLPNESSSQLMLPCSGLDALLHTPKGITKSPSVKNNLFGLSEEDEEDDSGEPNESAEWMQVLQVLSPGKIAGVVLSPFMAQPSTEPGSPGPQAPVSGQGFPSKDSCDVLLDLLKQGDEYEDDEASEEDYCEEDRLSMIMKLTQSCGNPSKSFTNHSSGSLSNFLRQAHLGDGGAHAAVSSLEDAYGEYLNAFSRSSGTARARTPPSFGSLN